MPKLIETRWILRTPFAAGILFLVYAWAIPDPHAFNNARLDRATWVIAGLLMLWAGFRPRTTPRVVALCAAVGLFAVRITVLAYYPSDLSTGRVIAGAVVWTMLAVFATAAMLSLEIIDAPTRLREL